MNELFTSQAFGIALTLAFFILGGYLYQWTRSPLMNPLLIATVLLMIYISVFQLDLHTFLTDLSGINVFLGPLIVSLALPIARYSAVIKRNWHYILIGSFVGALASMISVVVLANLFGLSNELMISLLPKSSTTPIAVEITERLGGIRAITVAAVVISAVSGAVIIPVLLRVLKIKDPRLIGLSLGATSHAVGTSKAIEINPNAGAISGVALVISGIATAILALFI